MTTRQLFHRTLMERRQYQRGSLDWDACTRAARKYLNLIRGIPVNQWSEQ